MIKNLQRIVRQPAYQAKPRRSSRSPFLPSLIACVLLGWALVRYEQKVAPVTPQAQTATVISVFDGDTFLANVGGEHYKVRLQGIDTPETVDPDRPVGCFGNEASDFTKGLLRPDMQVRLIQDPDKPATDTYGRLLRYVELPSGEDLGSLLLEGGYALEYTFRGEDYQHQAEYQELEEEARVQRRGLWGACGN